MKMMSIAILATLVCGCTTGQPSNAPSLDGELTFSEVSPRSDTYDGDPQAPLGICALSKGDGAAIVRVSGAPVSVLGCADGEPTGLNHHWRVPVSIAHHLGGDEPPHDFELIMSTEWYNVAPVEGDYLLTAWFADQSAHFASTVVRVGARGEATAQPPSDYARTYDLPTSVDGLQRAYDELGTPPSAQCLSADQTLADLKSGNLYHYRTELDCNSAIHEDDGLP